MKNPLPLYLAHLLDRVRDDRDGATADYIEVLAKANPELLGMALCAVDGAVYSVGDSAVEVSIQSISKPFAYALALETHGIDAVLKKVDVEPSGEAFNELSLEEGSRRPRNPMINSGAIAIHELLPGEDARARAEALRGLLSHLAGRTLHYDEAVFEAEMRTAWRNLAIGHMLRSFDIINGDPVEVVRGYVLQCAINVTVEDLARIAAVLANRGVEPVSGVQILRPEVVRQVLSVMTTCGMYDAAGDWLSTVGIPAKSGVSGGVLGALPGQVGVAVLSPRLDRFGNSVRGVRALKYFSQEMGLHLMDALQTPRASLRNPQAEHHSGMDVFDLQGDLHFSQAELLLRSLQQRKQTDKPVVLDVRRVHEISHIARRMLLDVVEAVHQDGAWIGLIDPERHLHDAQTQSGFIPPVFDSIQEALDTCPTRQLTHLNGAS